MLTNFIWKKLKVVTVISCAGYAAYCGFCYYSSESLFYRRLIMPIVHKLDPETSHLLAVEVLKKQLVSKPKFQDPPSLKSKIWNMEFDNPIGLAAGFDKHGEAIRGLHKIGFGFVEVGSVTPRPQIGNPKPRLFRLPQDKAVINRYGFNSDGHDAVFERLEPISRDDKKKRGIIGVNLGKNKDTIDTVDDYVQGVKKFGAIADYLVINVSSPAKGTKQIARRKQLSIIVDKAIETRNKLNMKRKTPILIKIAPDLSREGKEDVAAVLMRPGKTKVNGLIISNSTIARPENLVSPLQKEKGGLTGAPLKKISTDAIRTMYALTKGEICIIGVGGVSTGADAYEKIRAGASLVQVYTAIVYHGFPVITRIKKELAELLKKDGYRTVQDAVGADHWSVKS